MCRRVKALIAYWLLYSQVLINFQFYSIIKRMETAFIWYKFMSDAILNLQQRNTLYIYINQNGKEISPPFLIGTFHSDCWLVHGNSKQEMASVNLRQGKPLCTGPAVDFSIWFSYYFWPPHLLLYFTVCILISTDLAFKIIHKLIFLNRNILSGN